MTGRSPAGDGLPRVLGVLGGMGAAATALFYQEITAHTQAACDQQHIDTLILSHASLPDRTQAIATHRDAPLQEALIQDAKMLERLGADLIAMPCNTAHRYFDAVQSALTVPLLNMVEESVTKALACGEDGRGIGVLCTDGTRASGVYDHACDRLGARAVYPSPDAQAALTRLIYDHVKRGTSGGEALFVTAYDELKSAGCPTVILGCTELSVFRSRYGTPQDCIDSTDCLVRAVIHRFGKRYI